MKGLRKIPGGWQVRRQVNGRRAARSFSVKADAIAYVRNIERQDAGLSILQKPITLAEGRILYEAKLAQRGSPNTTLRFYKAKFAPLERILGTSTLLGSVNDAAVEDYVDRRKVEEVSNKTLREELGLLHRVTRRAGITPAWQLPSFRLAYHPRRAPSPEEIAVLWVQLKGPSRVALALCLLTGCRASEAFRLRAEDVNWKARTIRLHDRKTPDPVHVAMVGTLQALLPSEGLLVAASENAVRLKMVRVSKGSGIPTWYGPGLGRHAFASWSVAMGGFSSLQVAEALGHRLPLATPHYIHAAAVEPVRRPMSEFVEKTLLEALRDQSQQKVAIGATANSGERRRTLGDAGAVGVAKSSHS